MSMITKKIKNRIGMTLAEMLIVVAIIAVLGGLAFIAVYNYQRSMGQLERDGIAKEIFVAAQNHLTMAYGEGYLGSDDFGESGAVDKDGNPVDPVDGVYYYVVNGDIDEASVIGQMLPFGSIDETVRAGGSYIVRYQKDTGTVLDVFYCSRSGSSHAQYDHDLASDEYGTVLGLRDTEAASNKLARRNWNGHILGWYGGAEAATLPTLKLDAPVIEVVNKDILYAEVTDPNSEKEGAMLKIIIEGLSSGAKKAIDKKTGSARVTVMSGKNKIVLDDITKKGLHFTELDADTDVSFIPGENVSIRAVAYSTDALANIAYSTICTTNSLYAAIDDSDNDKTYETACVGYIRHLENLDKKVSNLGAAETVSKEKLEKFKIKKAVQTSDMDWKTFKTYTGSDTVCYSTGTGSSYISESSSKQYYPISPDYVLTYDGQGNSISNIETEFKDAGVFGSVQSGTVSEIKNLELIDFSVKGTDSAGALAGTLNGCDVTNVLARYKDGSAGSVANRITATGDAGGLIGKLTSGNVKYSAAAVIVGDTGTKPSIAGGLIGNAAGGTISGCYSAGFVEDIKAGSKVVGVQYSKTAFNVNGTTAGGLVGDSDVSIINSYSTCSVSGTTAGGFAGKASGSITNCYSTGYIDPGAVAKYAFIGSGSPGSGNYYYMAINEVASAAPGEGGGGSLVVPPADSDEAKNVTEPMLPYAGFNLETGLSVIKPLDMNAKAYNEFTGAWDNWGFARPYNSSLVKYYGGKYPLKTIKELDTAYAGTDDYFVVTHYGDWPSPEVFFIN